MSLIPFFKQSMNVNNAFFANSSNVVFGDVVINSVSLSVNSTVIGASSLSVGNTTVFTNLHYSGLSFIKGANSAVYNSSQISFLDSSARTSKINSSSWSLNSGNNLSGFITSLSLGNSTINASFTTNTLFLKDSLTFLRPNTVQINGGAFIDTTTLSVSSLSLVTSPASGILTGNSASLAVFNSTANGVILAANNVGTPINTNVHIISGAASWRKNYVWQQFVTLNSSSPTITWPPATFAVIDVTGYIRHSVGGEDLRFRFHHNGGTQSDAYAQEHFHIWNAGELRRTSFSGGTGVENGVAFGAPGDDDWAALIMWDDPERTPMQIHLRFFNCAGRKPFAYIRAMGFGGSGGVRLFEGWAMRDGIVVNANGVTGFQLQSDGGTKTGNLTITGIPL